MTLEIFNSIVAVLSLIITSSISYYTAGNSREISNVREDLASRIDNLDTRLTQIEARTTTAHHALAQELYNLDTRLDNFIETYLKDKDC